MKINIFTALVIFGTFCCSSSVNAISDYKPYDKSKVTPPNESFPAQVLVVKFKDDRAFRLRNGSIKLQHDISKSIVDADSAVKDAESLNEIVRAYDLILVPTFSDPGDALTEIELDELHKSNEQKTKKHFADLNNYFTLVSKQPTDSFAVWPVLEALNSLSSVEIAYIESSAVDASALPNMPYNTTFAPYQLPPLPAQQGWQGYLSNTVNGIHALDGWNWDGGKGENIKVIAVDDHINPYHMELVNKSWYGRWWSDQAHGGWNHGNAVAGILFAEDNNVGITGIVHGVSSWGFVSATKCFFSTCWLDSAYGLSDARSRLSPGDVISMSLGTKSGPGGTRAPGEWESAVFSATQAATAAGIVVVVSSSNSDLDLDDASYNGAFNLSVRDSGAIIVGGSYPHEEHGIRGNYGSRVSAHSWYNEVSTIAYDDIYYFVGVVDGNEIIFPSPPLSGGNHDIEFTQKFSGTSAATPIVAGAAASIQSIRKGMGLSPLSSVQMRSFISATGTAQSYDLLKHAGVTPNIQQAARAMQATQFQCSLGSSSAITSTYVYFPYLQVTNLSGVVKNNWTIYVDLNGVQPSTVYTDAAVSSYEIRDDVIALKGTSPLLVGETRRVIMYAAVGSTPSVECY